MARLSQPKYCLNEVEDYGIEAESGNPWQFLAIRGNPWYIPCQSVGRQVCAQFSSVWFVHLLSESRRWRSDRLQHRWVWHGGQLLVRVRMHNILRQRLKPLILPSGRGKVRQFLECFVTILMLLHLSRALHKEFFFSLNLWLMRDNNDGLIIRATCIFRRSHVPKNSRLLTFRSGHNMPFGKWRKSKPGGRWPDFGK